MRRICRRTPQYHIKVFLFGSDFTPMERKLLPALTLLKERTGSRPNDPCMLGFPANEAASIPIADIFAQNAKMNAGEGDPEDVERHASEWIAANTDLVEGWLANARAAAD